MKVYVEVDAVFDTEGNIKPTALKWEDGRVYHIEKILEMKRAVSMKAGGQGIRYLCRIHGRERYLYYDEPRWFVEA